MFLKTLNGATVPKNYESFLIMMNFCEIFDYPIYVVGGSVRDRLLGFEDKDIDIASDLEPQKFKNLCKKLKIRTADTGIDHGTVTAIINGKPYEHTTFREDVSNDGRNATIKFSKTIEEDLSRRDFTINAIAMLRDKIIDPFHGREDLKSRILRTVGEPSERFSEDYLRIIRAARFQARFDLKLAPGLKESASKLSPNIMTHVSIERVTDEFRKAKKHGHRFIKCAKNLGFLKFVLPEYESLSENNYDVWLDEISCSKNFSDLQFFAALLLPLNTGDVNSIARKFKLSNQTCKGLVLFEKHANDLDKKNFNHADCRRLMLNLKNYFADFCTRVESIKSSSDYEKRNLEFISNNAQQIQLSISSPFIDGAYLKKAGLKPGPHFKDILDKAGEAQAAGKNEQEVVELIENLVDEHKS